MDIRDWSGCIRHSEAHTTGGIVLITSVAPSGSASPGALPRVGFVTGVGTPVSTIAEMASEPPVPLPIGVVAVADMRMLPVVALARMLD